MNFSISVLFSCTVCVCVCVFMLHAKLKLVERGENLCENIKIPNSLKGGGRNIENY